MRVALPSDLATQPLAVLGRLWRERGTGLRVREVRASAAFIEAFQKQVAKSWKGPVPATCLTGTRWNGKPYFLGVPLVAAGEDEPQEPRLMCSVQAPLLKPALFRREYLPWMARGG